MTSRKPLLVLVAASLFGLGAALVQGQDDETPLIEYRQKAMSGIRASMGSVGDIMKFKLDHGMEHVAVHASNISHYASLVPDAFEKKITAGKTDAKPEIWDNWEDFVAKAGTLEKAASDLSSAAESGDMRQVAPALKAVGDACRGCHDSYRKPEEERFPR